MGIGRNPSAFVFHEQQIAETPQFVTGIGYHTVLRGPDRRAFSGKNVNPVILQAFPDRTEP